MGMEQMDSDQHGIPQAESDFESGLNDDDRLDLRIWLRLLTCANMIERRVRQNLRTNFDTTLPRFDVLAQIDRAPEGQPMRELSHRLMVTNGNITPLVDRLEEEGLVIREPSAKDRRVQHVKLTNAGTEALDAMIPENKRWVSNLMQHVDRDRASDLYALLGDLKESILASERDQ